MVCSIQNSNLCLWYHICIPLWHIWKSKYMLLSRHQNAGQNHDITQVTDGLKLWHSSDIWERR
jgi:hypothetical protein